MEVTLKEFLETIEKPERTIVSSVMTGECEKVPLTEALTLITPANLGTVVEEINYDGEAGVLDLYLVGNNTAGPNYVLWQK